LNHLELGVAGEHFAAEHIESIGWRIIARNVRVGRGELDIIAVDGDELVIVEVRTRRIGYISPSETTVGPNKLKSILKTARKYVERILSYDGNWRIDIAAVTVDKNGAYSIEMFSDVTMGMEGGYML
jgi:putative endonuclease